MNKNIKFAVSDKDFTKALEDYKKMFGLKEDDEKYISTKNKVESILSSGKSINVIFQELLKDYKNTMNVFKKTAKAYKKEVNKDKEFVENMNKEKEG